MSAYYCPSCYGRKKYCRRCKTFHCPPDGCTWNRPNCAPKKKVRASSTRAMEKP